MPTREQILEMPAGAEMDALIAEVVFGFSGRVMLSKRKHNASETVIGFRQGDQTVRLAWPDFERWYTSDGIKLHCAEPWGPHFPNIYSTDISQAWRVVAVLNGSHYVTVRNLWAYSDEHGGTLGFAAQFIGFQQLSGEWAMASTVELAICRAALLALAAAPATPATEGGQDA